MKQRQTSRRRFLAGCARLTLGSAGLYATLGSLNLVRALAASGIGDYRALVCIFLSGGNDSFNMLVPRGDDAYADYADARRNLALPREALLPVVAAGPAGAGYGFHPSMPGAQRLFDEGRLAVLSNVGALIEPVTRAGIQGEQANLPKRLFSHNDQLAFWQRLGDSAFATTGWAGRMADLLLAQTSNPLGMNVSLSGSNLWQTGATTLAYSVTPEGAVTLRGIDPDSPDRATQVRSESFLQLLESTSLYQSEIGQLQKRAMDTAASLDETLAQLDPLSTAFPDDRLGDSLAMAARMIQARDKLGVGQQIFLIVMHGWDNHSNQLGIHPGLLGSLSAGLDAFYRATEELGVADKVTTFTGSDFGRTLTSNGDGTDHAWGGNQLVVGGMVNGGSVCGDYPSLALGSELDIGGGRLIPTTSVDQYGAELARWFASFTAGELDEIFPNLRNFAPTPLGLFA